MEKQHFSIASKWTTVYFFIVVVYNFYIKFTEGDFNIVWLILLIGLVIYWGIATYLNIRRESKISLSEI